MNEENKGLSLRDTLAAGFERVAAEENAGAAEQGGVSPEQAGSPDQSAQEAPAVRETPASDAPAQPAQVDATQAQTQPAQPDRLAMAMQLIETLRGENARLTAQNQQQAQAMAQQSQAAEAAIENSVTIPQLNFRDLQYMSDEEQQAAISQWQQAVAESTLAQVRGEIAPIRRDYEDKMRIAANDAARSSIFGDSRFSDFEGNSADIERIASSADFQAMSPEHRYLYSGLIARGLKHDPTAQPSTDEIVQMALANPDVLRAIETRRAQEVQRKNDSLPTLSASTGFGGANPVPENSVKTKEELEARMKQRFGL